MAAISPNTNLEGFKKSMIDGIDGAFKKGVKYGRYLAQQAQLGQKEAAQTEWISKICRMVNDAKVLDMLQEECAELIQAASKCKRAMDGEPSVDPCKARGSLVEELADVGNMIALTMHKLLTTEENAAVCSTEAAKMERYYNRLCEMEGKREKVDG